MSRHPRGWTGRKYRPRRRAAPAEPTLQHPGPARLSIRQSRLEKVQVAKAREAAAALRQRLDRRDEREARLIESTKDGPMISAPVWHVHANDGRER